MTIPDDLKAVIPYIEDKRVTDIAIGIGGELIVEGMGMGKQFTGIYFDDATTTRIIYASAAVLGVTIDPDNPIVEGVLPNWKIRIEGILPPRATENPMYFIRRPPAAIFKMESYVEQGRMTKEMKKVFRNSLSILTGCALVLSLFSCGEKKSSAKTVKIGVLYSTTDNFSLSETPMQNAARMAIDEINAAGGQIVSEEYTPTSETDFSSVVNRIKASGADCVFSAVAGNSNVPFYKDYVQYGMDPKKVPLCSIASHESNHHCYLNAYIGQVQEDLSYKILVASDGLVEPIPE